MSNRPTEMVYNPKTGDWEEISVSTAQQTPDIVDNEQTSKEVFKGTNSPIEKSGTEPSSSKVNAQAQADKEFIEEEFNTLEGELTLKVSKRTIKIKAGDTIRIEGIGKFLSGLYYVSAVKRSIDSSSGYSHTLTVIKTGFGDSLKGDSTEDSPESRLDEASVSISTNFKVGDKVMFLTAEANKYTYSNAHEGTYVPKWVTEKTHTIDKVSSDGKRVRLKEVWSWTYTSFLKKV